MVSKICLTSIPLLDWCYWGVNPPQWLRQLNVPSIQTWLRGMLWLGHWILQLLLKTVFVQDASYWSFVFSTNYRLIQLQCVDLSLHINTCLHFYRLTVTAVSLINIQMFPHHLHSLLIVPQSTVTWKLKEYSHSHVTIHYFLLYFGLRVSSENKQRDTTHSSRIHYTQSISVADAWR
jgi:hypothetical protein